jgi:2-polyprenyl-6-methoxyphenol hydroxylase-like FAD-dependent oxidoreductase
MTLSPPGTTPVLIVGAGPTGLTLGIELARRQIPFRLIDRKVERALSSRALGTQPRTIEVFRLMGIPEAALQPAVRPRAFRFMEGRRMLVEIEFATSAIVMNEVDTERVLQERLEECGGRVEWATTLESFRLASDRVIASLAGPGGPTAIAAKFLVGCDGANSTVRREAGIGFTGATYAERFLLADLVLDWEMAHDEATIWFGDEAGLAPSPKATSRCMSRKVRSPLAPSRSCGGGRVSRCASSESRSGPRRFASTANWRTATGRVRSSWPGTRRTSTVPSAGRG